MFFLLQHIEVCGSKYLVSLPVLEEIQGEKRQAETIIYIVSIHTHTIGVHGKFFGGLLTLLTIWVCLKTFRDPPQKKSPLEETLCHLVS